MDQHECIIKVRGFHLDYLGHVNNARYLEFLEEARWSYYENSPGVAKMSQRKLGMVIANININFRAPAVLGDSLRIVTAVKSMGTRSLVYEQTIYLNDTDKIATVAEITVVVIDLETQKSIPIDDEMKEALLSH